EPLFEISTDKVDAEIPAPATGVLEEIKVSEGTTVQVNTVVGTIASDGEPAAAPKAAAEKKAAPPAAKAEAPAAMAPPAPAPAAAAAPAHEDEEHARSSPLVRKIARENSVDLSKVPGTGLGGRITKQDILSFIEGQSAPAPASAAYEPPLPRPELPHPAPSTPAPAPVSRPAPALIPGDL